MKWSTAFKGYLNPAVAVFLFLGFSCGLPHSLIGYSLSLWLKDAGLSLAAIGFFALVMLPYNFKFLWAPFLDRFSAPFLPRAFGHRKGWLILFQLGLIACTAGLAFSAPESNEPAFSLVRDGQKVVIPLLTYFFAFGVAFFAASQDIMVDALRIGTLKKEELGEGAGAYQFGYRMGMLLSGAGVVAASAFVSWQTAYACVAVLLLAGLITVFFIKEPPEKKVTQAGFFKSTVVAPFVDFMKQNQWALILIFIVLYKLCNAVLGRMALPFYSEMGFSKAEIALVSGTIGPWITILGVAIGGVLVMKYAILNLLFVFGCIEILTSVVFGFFTFFEHSMSFFLLVILFDNIVGGMGGAVFVAFLSGLCSKRYAATQYALLTSLMMVSVSVISVYSGVWAEQMGWFWFFLFTGALMVPALILLGFLICKKAIQK